MSTSISFASPGIAKEWGIDRGALGIVLSMEVIGMAIGSMFLGGVADKIGRRRTVLACTTVMALGMFMVPTTRGLVELSIWRVFTGLGIGGMLATINAIAAEFSNTKRRDLSVSVMSIGYPIGAVVGGILAQRLLAVYDWRSVFYLGAIATTVLIPVVFIFVPESVQWLTQRRPAGALDRVNETLRRMGHGAVANLPALSASARKLSIADVFKPGLASHHGPRHTRVLLSHHNVLLHHEVGSQDRNGFWIPGILGGGRSSLGERRRHDRWSIAWSAHAKIRGEGAHDRKHAHRDGHGFSIRHHAA